MIAIEAAGRGLEVIARGCVGAVDAGSPFDDVEVELENALLAEDEFGGRNEGELGSFAEIRTAGAEEEVFDELLRDGGGTAAACAFKVVFGGNLNLMPVEAVVLVEAGVLSGDDGVLEFWGDLGDGNEPVALVIGSAVNEGLKAALRLHSCGGWVDPAEGDEGAHGESPGEGESDRDAEQDGSHSDALGPNGSKEFSP